MTMRPEKPPEMIRDCTSFTQEADCCASGSGYQNLIIKEEDGGGGSYYAIETERWAFGSIEEFVSMLRRAGCRETCEPDGMAPPKGEHITVKEV